ncbi:MAG TPA: polysaccharide deacetylase family protein [Coleofasciculaceae cyanobacterium]
MIDLTYSDRLYQPSLMELAQLGNHRALTYWMNSLLAPQGIRVQVQPASTRYFIKILIDFQPPARRETCSQLRDRLVRFICYRLWTLNSEAILGVKIVARMAGDSRVLWQQSVRINTPANSERLRQIQALRAAQREAGFGFQFLRAVILSSVTLAGFYIGYRLFYLELSRALGKIPMVQPLSTLTQGSGKSQVALVQARVTAGSDPSVITVPEQFQGKVVSQITPANGEKVIALTFDDGPWPDSTEAVLDILKQNQIKATFFMVGLHIQRHPELAKRVAEEGHVIGNHTLNHPLQDVSLADATAQIDGMEKLIYETTGVKTGLFRPPGGRFDGALASYAHQRKYAVTLWSVDSEDYYVAAPILLDNVLKNVQPGRIVLLHDGGGDRSATVKALPQIISALKQRGYRFVTVPELMNLQSPEQKPDGVAPHPQDVPAVNASSDQPELQPAPAGVDPTPLQAPVPDSPVVPQPALPTRVPASTEIVQASRG